MKKSLLMLTAAAFVCAGASAHAQQNVVVQPDASQPGGYPLPDGSAKLCRTLNVCQLRNIVNPNKSPQIGRNPPIRCALPALLINDGRPTRSGLT
jgi:hypothetical protein